jgi:hypothetical protein
LRAWFLIVVIAMSLIATRVRASEPARIAIVHELSADERAIGRLRAELSTLGLEVVDVTLALNEGATAFDDAARRVNAFAAVHVIPGKGGVEVWIADRATGKTLFREHVIGPGEEFDDVVALKAGELLRASLAELGLSPKGEQAVPAPRPMAPAAPLPLERRADAAWLFLELGPAVAMSPGGVDATAHGFVGLRWRASRFFGLDGFASIPVTAATVAAPEGSADVRPWLLGLDVAVWFFDPQAAWQVAGAAGLGVAHLAIAGSPTPPLLGRRDTTTVAFPFTRFSVDRSLGARFRIGLHGFVGIAAPRPTLRFDEREVADWGQPVVVSTLVLGIALD